MHLKFKKHQKVRLLVNPSDDDIEPYADPPVQIKAGMIGEVNVILPNGRYHLKIVDKKGDEVAYVAVDEDFLEAVE